jgi:ClpX C4-type zinc finger
MPSRKPTHATMRKSSSPPRCSFCWRARDQVARLVAGPGVTICDACIALSSRVLTGKPTAAFAGRDSMSDEDLLATLPAAASAVDGAEEQLRAHVDRIRSRGISWERIAGALGVSRQAVWGRFSGEI